jgi:hypothetical protein
MTIWITRIVVPSRTASACYDHHGSGRERDTEDEVERANHGEVQDDAPGTQPSGRQHQPDWNQKSAEAGAIDQRKDGQRNIDLKTHR